MTTDCNSRYVYADPFKGCMIAVSEAARNIVCSGGTPLGVTNCLNFGNPYDPEVYYQFVYAIKGMGEACKKFNTPVTGGNVSFYNQNPDGAVYPTPTIGMVGLLEDINNKMTLDFKSPGDKIYLLGEVTDDLGSSEYLHKICGVEFSPVPYFDLDAEFRLQEVVSSLIRGNNINAAHDISEGGLFITLFESAAVNDLGFDVNSNGVTVRKDAFWFGESQSRVVVSVAATGSKELEAILQKTGLPFICIGEVTKGALVVDGKEWGNISGWRQRYDTVIEKYMNAYHAE
jgi:phosphoribosylformylglycinamidine synthase